MTGRGTFRRILDWIAPLPDGSLEAEREQARERLQRVREEADAAEMDAERKIEDARREIRTKNPEEIPLTVDGFMRSLMPEGRGSDDGTRAKPEE